MPKPKRKKRPLNPRRNNPSTQPELFPAVLSRAAGGGANRTSLPVITPQCGTPATGRPSCLSLSPRRHLTPEPPFLLLAPHIG